MKNISTTAILIIGFVLLFGSWYWFYVDDIKPYLENGKNGNIACTEEAKLCPDGSAVGRTGPKCEFAECPEISDISDWKTYRNEKYGFEIKFPSRWSSLKIDVVRDDNFGAEYINFQLKTENSATYRNVCEIVIYSEKNWKGLSADEPKPIYLDSRKGMVYSWGCGHDDYGFVGFEMYNKDVDNGDFNTPESETPYGEFRLKVLPTFKFTDQEFKTSGTVSGKVSIGPLCPVEPCNTTIDPYSGKQLIFTPTGGGRPVDLPFYANLKSDGSYSIELPYGNYSVTLSDCQYMGCSYAFPKTIKVENNKNLEFNIDIDTGIR